MRHSLCPALLIIGSGMTARAQDIAGEFPRGSATRRLAIRRLLPLEPREGGEETFSRDSRSNPSASVLLLRAPDSSLRPDYRPTVHHAWVRVSALYRRAVDGAHAVYASSIRGRCQLKLRDGRA